jgi:hypothetical protein
LSKIYCSLTFEYVPIWEVGNGTLKLHVSWFFFYSVGFAPASLFL